MVWVAKEDATRRIRTEFPRDIRVEKNVRIPMRDGTELSANIWLPIDAEAHPVPAILEYIPYRKNDFTALRDSLRHPYFAGHGYASVRVDMRGSGDSEGVLFDEYLPQEQEDGIDVINWLAAQPWCTGNVGMIGKSWGGFNGVQIAAHAPEALKAVIALCFTDDRYTDDVHYRGGAVLGSEMLYWATTMLAYNARPADPKYVPNWREQWLERLHGSPALIETWLDHPLRDDYWKQGSINEDYSAIKAPILAVGGWNDGYINPVFRVLEHMGSPVKAIVGPWVHEYPEVATPGPAIGFLQEALRWYDQYLKGEDTGVENDPDLRVWMQEYQEPTATVPETAEGEFIGVQQWPPVDAKSVTLHGHGNGMLSAEGAADIDVLIDTPLSHGLYGGVWCPFGVPGDLASDQRHEDRLAVAFETAPATEEQSVLGFPELEFTVAADTDEAHLIARLCDVAPDGTSRLVNVGIVALHQSDDHSEIIPCKDQVQTRKLKLDAIGYDLAPGHKWRLALATHYWPRVWPTPIAPKLTLSNVSLTLPLAPTNVSPVAFEPPETAQPIGVSVEGNPTRTRDLQHDYLENSWTITEYSDTGMVRLADGIGFQQIEHDVYTIASDDPLSAKVTCERIINIERDGWTVRVEAISAMTGSGDSFRVVSRVELYDEDELVGEHRWDKTIQRARF